MKIKLSGTVDLLKAKRAEIARLEKKRVKLARAIPPKHAGSFETFKAHIARERLLARKLEIAGII